MKKQWLDTFATWSRTPQYRQTVQSTKQEIRTVLQRYKRPYVAYSGGKDSLVVLHLCLQEKPIEVFHWNYQKHLMPFEEEVLQNAYKLGEVELTVRTSAKYANEKLARHVHIMGAMFHHLDRLIKEKGWDLAILGLRKEEGVKRKHRCNTENLRYMKEYGITMYYPVRDWSWLDIWAYIVSNKLSYPKVYDTLAQFRGYDRVRFTTFFDDEFTRFGNLDDVLLRRYKNMA